MNSPAGALLFLVCPAMMLAQTELLRSSDRTSLTVEVLFPNFDNTLGAQATGMTVLLSGGIAVTDLVSIKLEVPYVETTTEFGGSSSSKSSLANTYLGVGLGKSSELVSGEFGVRLNTLAEKNSFAGFSGIFGDFPRIERYLTEATTVHAGVNVRPRFDQFSVLLRFSPMLWIPEGGGDNELFSSYGVGAAYESDIINAGAGVNGLWMMTEQGGFFGNKDALHHVQLEVNKEFGMLRPGIMFRVPLDKELDMINYTIGAYVNVLL